MLRLQDPEEGFAEGFLGAARALPGYRYGLVRARCCLVLDQVFKVIVIDIDCCTLSVAVMQDVPEQRRHSQCPHSGMLLWRNVSPYFMTWSKNEAVYVQRLQPRMTTGPGAMLHE